MPQTAALSTAPSAVSSLLVLDLPAGSLSIALPPATVREMQQALATLTARLKAVAIRAAENPRQPQPEPSIEYRHAGEVALELFCNPNIWPTPFAAKVLLSVRDDRLRLSSEVELVQLRDCLDRYFEQRPD